VISRRWLVAVLAAGLSGCGIGSGPLDASSIDYDVSYADRSPGEAYVVYTDADGRTVTTRVGIPWRSGAIEVRPGVRYQLSATARDAGVNLSCDIHTDTGWTAGSASAERCQYVFPDDVRK
jgi:hypothetical protein